MTNTYYFNPILESREIILASLEEDHREGLEKAALDESLWTYNKPQQSTLIQYVDDYFEQLFMAHKKSDPFAYTVFCKRSNAIIGSTRYYGISSADKRLCIGFTWYSKTYWGTKINPESKLLLLSQAFEDLGVNRVEFHVDTRNERSLSAMKYLGATLECVMKKHKIVQNNYVRDTALFSVVNDEWPLIKQGLKRRVGA